MTLNSKIIPVRTFNGSAIVAEPFPSELATIPNLQAFFCADYNTVSSGNTQQTWTNILGDTAYDLTQATAGNRPAISTSAFIGGKKFLAFNGATNSRIMTNASSGLTATKNVAAFSCAVVWVSNTTSAAQQAVHFNNGTVAAQSRFVINKTSGNFDDVGGRKADGNSFAGSNSSNTLPNGTWHITVGCIDYFNCNTALYRNGTLVAGLSGTFQAPTGSNTSNTNSLSMSIGAIDTSTNRLNGGIALVLFGTGYWATATIGSETVEEYITRVCGSYYGLAVS